MWQHLNIGLDYPVPVDKHDIVWKFTPFPWPLDGFKGQIFKFHNNSVVNYFTEISHADRVQ